MVRLPRLTSRVGVAYGSLPALRWEQIPSPAPLQKAGLCAGFFRFAVDSTGGDVTARSYHGTLNHAGRERTTWADIPRHALQTFAERPPLPLIRPRWGQTIGSSEHSGQCHGAATVLPSAAWVEPNEHGEDGWGGVPSTTSAVTARPAPPNVICSATSLPMPSHKGMVGSTAMRQRSAVLVVRPHRGGGPGQGVTSMSLEGMTRDIGSGGTPP
jgi:hypothetical protein